MYYTQTGFAMLEDDDPIEWVSWAANYNMQHTMNRIMEIRASKLRA